MDRVYLLTKCIAKIVEQNSGELYNEIHGHNTLTPDQWQRLHWLKDGAEAVTELLEMATDYQKYLAERTPHDDHDHEETPITPRR